VTDRRTDTLRSLLPVLA